jgi:hypothetical protein
MTSLPQSKSLVEIRGVEMPKVTWLAVDDWHAIYIDGELIGEQGHSVSPWTWMDVLDALGAEVDDQRYSEQAEKWAEELGRFPEHLT